MSSNDRFNAEVANLVQEIRKVASLARRVSSERMYKEQDDTEAALSPAGMKLFDAFAEGKKVSKPALRKHLMEAAEKAGYPEDAGKIADLMINAVLPPTKKKAMYGMDDKLIELAGTKERAQRLFIYYGRAEYNARQSLWRDELPNRKSLYHYFISAARHDRYSDEAIEYFIEEVNRGRLPPSWETKDWSV